MDNKQKKPRTVEEILSDPRVKIIQSGNQEESFNAPKKTKTVEEILSDPRVKVTKEVDSSIGKQAKDFVSGFSSGATSNFSIQLKSF
jgi:general stress protein 26